MAFAQYPEPIVVIICNGPQHVIDLGTAKPTVSNTQLSVFGCQIFKYGVQPSVQLRVNAYYDGELQASSNWFRVSQIENDPELNTTGYFYGWIRFTFEPRINFRTALSTRFELELMNYSFSEAQWIGAVLDWPITMGYNTTPGDIEDTPIAMELYQAEPVK